MGKTDASVIKLPDGYSLKKIDERTYELVKIDDFKKGDFLFAKSRTGDLIDYVFINTGGLKANFLYKDKNVLICNLEFNFSNNYDISKATLEQIAAMRRLLSENNFTIVDGEVVPITDPVVGFVIVGDVIYPASKIYRSRECAMYDLRRKINKKMNQVKFLKLRRDAVLPEKNTDGAAGYDLYVPDNTLIRKGRNLIKLGIAIQMPSNMKAIIKPRSGFSLKGIIGVDGKYHDADVLDGVIDCDYTGCIGVIVKSFEKEPFYIAAKERIAQLLFSNYIEVEFVEVESLDSTDRGDGGFGHTNNAGK